MVERERKERRQRVFPKRSEGRLPRAVMLFDSVVFLLFSLCVPATQQDGAGLSMWHGMSPSTLPGHNGSCFPIPASRLEAAAALPKGCSGSHMHKSDCEPWGWTHASPVAILTFPPSLFPPCALPMLAITSRRMQPVGCRGCSWPL